MKLRFRHRIQKLFASQQPQQPGVELPGGYPAAKGRAEEGAGQPGAGLPGADESCGAQHVHCLTDSSGAAFEGGGPCGVG
eukprot:CAMPEP_0117688740 /NCGR_PEP_ID=MMETSP0804-20121206/24032_1 /TAXON_ID=1074897 /ORGANISM="Tetraselmis astigmatica, Strain CCMP880" /LENGTH=79 /DNA_ID=CAMNT_0005501295 /DNA_START=232 /DNA_END=468 /DNA_ORIENTATION=-